jgi:cell shape-determining protein MreC
MSDLNNNNSSSPRSELEEIIDFLNTTNDDYEEEEDFKKLLAEKAKVAEERSKQLCAEMKRERIMVRIPLSRISRFEPFVKRNKN